MNVLFIPCSLDGLKGAGSIRVRCEWVADRWDEAEVWDGTQRLLPGLWDLVVFQKAYLLKRTRRLIETVAEWRDDGHCRLAFDLCDPDFLSQEHRERMMKVLGLFDFCVGSTEKLTRWLARWNVAYHVPDCVDVEAMRSIGTYEPRDVEDPVLVWAGYENNSGALFSMGPTVGRLGWPLEIVAVKESIPFEEYWQRVLRNRNTGEPHDVMLNPRPQTGRFAWKSDNKTQAAWALGMPVARTPEELESFADPEARVPGEPRDISVAVEKWREIAEEWTI
jgi:hypothetical protein